MKKTLTVIVGILFSGSVLAALSDGGKVLELSSVSTVVGSANTTKDTSFRVKISGSGQCAGKYIKFQTNVNSAESLNRSFSMLTAAYFADQRVSIQGAYANSSCDLGSQVRLIK
ncbi:hypothetical protein HQQ94_11385 [Shewanella sp. VB17]|uniref:DUF5992 family protein n=1 Tax=Shewanella sp. VB17 TaxID=2739432 RepID=UPI001566AC6B|nr:DUF5992 family protein [Shewanella sp. VB17]NRD73820.1 hypothetical protein [Shewanella sp. VB17]NRD73829.1 hypothetical protein [Shewanella sp. VB17]